MRRRLTLTLLVLALLAIGGFAVPLLLSTADRRTQTLVLDRAEEMDRLVLLAADGERPNILQRSARRYTELYGEGLLVLDASGEVEAATGRWDGVRTRAGLDEGTAAVVDAAVLGLPAGTVDQLRPWSRTPVLLTRSLGPVTGISGVVVMEASVRDAATDVARAWTAVLGGAAVAVLAAAAAARAVSGWLLRPLLALRDGVAAVRSGREGAQVAHPSGPDELRALTISFNAMSTALARSAAAQRRLVADASHQLRNPLAALRLRVDVLATQLPPGLRTSGDQVGGELGRLERLLDDLDRTAAVDAGPPDAAVGPVPLLDVVADRLVAWRAASDAAGVRLHPPEGGGAPQVWLSPGTLEQVLDVVLHNAVLHAGPGATVRWTLAPGDGALRLRAVDDGVGLAPEHLALAAGRFWRGPGTSAGSGSGLGLGIAATLLAHDGAELHLGAHHPHGLVVELVLPTGPAR